MTNPTSDLHPAPAPMTAEAMLLALIKANHAERDETQKAIDLHTAEANRLDAIGEGLKGALRAIRYPASSSSQTAEKPPLIPSPPPPPAMGQRG